jgi:hypothetical protein
MISLSRQLRLAMFTAARSRNIVERTFESFSLSSGMWISSLATTTLSACWTSNFFRTDTAEAVLSAEQRLKRRLLKAPGLNLILCKRYSSITETSSRRSIVDSGPGQWIRSFTSKLHGPCSRAGCGCLRKKTCQNLLRL